MLTIHYTWVDPLVRLIFSITYSKEKVCLPNGNVVDLCLRYLPLYYSTSRKKVEHLGNFLHISTSQLRLTVWRFKLEGNFSIRRAKWVKFIGRGFKSSLLLCQQKERRASWKFSAHINIEVAPNCLAL